MSILHKSSVKYVAVGFITILLVAGIVTYISYQEFVSLLSQAHEANMLSKSIDDGLHNLLDDLVITGSIGLVLYVMLSIYIVSRVKIAETKLSEQNIESKRMSVTDDLTGLYNRRGYDEQIKKVVCDQRQRENVLMTLDLDKFKEINDTLGHASGDEMLHSISTIFTEQVRETDIVCRIGGDEFAIILSDCTLDCGLNIADKIITAVDNFAMVRNTIEFKVGVSIGITEMPNDLTEIEGMFRAVDGAMYKAKENGRNRTEIACIGNNCLL